MKNFFLLLILLSSALHGAEAAGGIKVKPVWWRAPSQTKQLYVEGKDGKPAPVRILSMCILDSFEATSDKEVILLDRIEPVLGDKTSKVSWKTYASAALPAGGHEWLMLLLPSTDGLSCQTRMMSLDESSLKWGGTRFTNFTNEQLVGQIAGKPFSVTPGESITLPFVATRRSVVEVILAADSKAGRSIVFSSKGIFSPTKRTLLFIINGREPGTYETRAIEQPNPDPKAYEEDESDAKPAEASK
jgi:hypothetical protein